MIFTFCFDNNYSNGLSCTIPDRSPITTCNKADANKEHDIHPNMRHSVTSPAKDIFTSCVMLFRPVQQSDTHHVYTYLKIVSFYCICIS